MHQRVKICAYCGQEIHGYPATSRKDNKTLICGICSVLEARRELAMWQQAAQRSSIKH